MRTIVLFGVALLVFGLVATAEAQLPPPAWAQSYDLLAGQTNVIGSVKVWNDDTTLYVYFDTAEDLLETHVHVGAALADIPQTKKGNPIPGQFDSAIYYPNPHLHGFDVASAGTELFIAAHAADILKTMTVSSGTDVDAAYGPIYSYAPKGDPAWSLGSAMYQAPHSAWLSDVPDPWGAPWITVDPLDPTLDTWRWFHDEIYVPGYPLPGSLRWTVDNAADVLFNEVLVDTRGAVQGTPNNTTDRGIFRDLYTVPLDPLEGLNTLDFVCRNYAGSASGNPAGLTYEVSVEYYDGESAWGDGPQFDGKNWATYMTYTVQESRWDLTGTYVYHYVCVSNCSGTWNHDMVITSHDLETGDFLGYGGYPAGADPYTITWIITGNVDGDEIVWYNIDYDSSSYLVVGTGTIASDGSLSGDATAGSQVATWYADSGTATLVWGPPWP